MNLPDPNNKHAFTGVRPGFAAVVFGVPAALILVGLIFGSLSLYGYVTGMLWAGSLLALAVRGFLNEEGDAFAPVENRIADLMPPFLAIYGVAALLEGERTPGVLLLALVIPWAIAAPSWRPFWRSRFVRAIHSNLHILHRAATLSLLIWLVWIWFKNEA